MRSKAEVVAELRTMLKDVFAARTDGAAYARLARAHGYVDGYMRAAMDAGLLSKDELLRIVAEERAVAYGPATAEISGETVAA